MRWRRLICGAVACLVAGVALARPGVVVTRDGLRFEGDVNERNDQLVVTAHGVDTTIAKDNVASFTYTDEFNKEFDDRLAKLAKNDVPGRIALARWAFDKRQYGKSREALDSALQIDPNNREAYDLQNTITSQLRMEEANTAAPTDANGMPTPPPNPTGVERRMLTANDINIIRQKELQSNDTCSIRFEHDVDRRFIQYAKLQFNQFNALKPVDKAIMILDQGDDSMKPDVKILGDPGSLTDYRRVIEPIVLSGCAASNCHGGLRGGDLILYNPVGTEQLSYTNFYILNVYKKKLTDPLDRGVFSSPDRRMIDRGQAVKSILAQYTLSPDIAQIAHPQVDGYAGIIHSVHDLRYKQLVDWMDKSLKPVSPDYGIKFDPPKAPTSEPATQAGP